MSNSSNPVSIPLSVFIGIDLNFHCPNPCFSVFIHSGFDQMEFSTRMLGQCLLEKRQLGGVNKLIDIQKVDAKLLKIQSSQDFIDEQVSFDLEEALIDFLTQFSESHKVKVCE